MHSAQQLRHKYECIVALNLDESPRLLRRMLIELLNIAGSLEELHTMIKQSESDNFSIFDFDSTNLDVPKTQKKQLRAYLSLMAKPGGRNGVDDYQIQNLVNTSFRNVWKTAEERKSLVDSMHKLLEIEEWNSSWVGAIGVKDRCAQAHNIGCFSSLFRSLFNHSCDPNVEWINVGNKMVYVVRLPIKAAEQLFVSYRWNHSCNIKLPASYLHFFQISFLHDHSAQ